MKTKKELYLPDIVGKGYGTFWNFKGRYKVVKGSRASKKSKTTALWIITKMMEYPEANTLVVRKVFRTLKDSCFTDLKWAINRLGVDAHWRVTESPLEITYIPTGQKILFRGLDDPLKVTSITVEHGVLCWAWLEEAYEITSEEDFDLLDESIRGKMPDGLFKQWIITFNPWNEHHWLKRRFFDVITGYDQNGKPIYAPRKNPISDDGDILAFTTNYLCNEWLDKADNRLFENMKKNNPRRYQVAGLGNWGIVDGLVYENWKEESFDVNKIRKKPGIRSAFGLDFGYTNDPTALFCGLIDLENRKIYVFDEMYEKGLSNKRIYENVANLGFKKEKITADSAEPKSIDELESLGLRRIHPAKKGKDSILNGVQWIQEFEIIIHPKCANFITEIGNYQWSKDKLGNMTNKPIDDFNHLMDAMRYGLEEFIIGSDWLF